MMPFRLYAQWLPLDDRLVAVPPDGADQLAEVGLEFGPLRAVRVRRRELALIDRLVPQLEHHASVIDSARHRIPEVRGEVEVGVVEVGRATLLGRDRLIVPVGEPDHVIIDDDEQTGAGRRSIVLLQQG